MNSKKSLIGTALSILFLLIAWPPNSFVYLLFIAYTPILWICFSQKKIVYSFIYFYIFYLLFLGIENWELFHEGYHLKASIWGLFLLPLFWSIPVLAANYLKRIIGLNKAIAIFPILYFLQEWLQMNWDLSFIWFHNGFAFGQSRWANLLYPLIGQLGIGFIVIIINCLLVWIIFNKTSRTKVFIASLSIFTIVLFPLLIAITTSAEKTENNIEVALFSPSSIENKMVKDDLRAQINLFVHHLKKIELESIDLVVGPEGFLNDVGNNPLFVNQLDSLGPIKELKAISEEIKTPILMGAILVQLIEGDDYPSTTAKKRKNGGYFEIYNGSILVDYRKETEWRTKNELIPIVEFIPFNSIINSSWSPWERIDKGYGFIEKQENYTINEYSISTSICYESLFRANWKKNTDLHIVLSNDWTRNESTLKQNLIYLSSVVKTTRTPILYSSMNNESVFIKNTGKILYSKSPERTILNIDF